METYDWSRFIKRIAIKASVQQIYDSWATAAGLEKWFLRKTLIFKEDKKPRAAKIPIQKGDSYQWYWHGYGDEAVEYGTILDANGKDSIRFNFGKSGTVSIIIREEKNEIMLELIQDTIPVDEMSRVNIHLACSTGWVFYLANLKSILEGGIDLRNKNSDILNVINS